MKDGEILFLIAVDDLDGGAGPQPLSSLENFRPTTGKSCTSPDKSVAIPQVRAVASARSSLALNIATYAPALSSASTVTTLPPMTMTFIPDTRK